MSFGLASKWTLIEDNLFAIESADNRDNQLATNDAFSEKWKAFSREQIEDQEKLFEFQKEWFLELYGYESEVALEEHLGNCEVILDAGCGLGYKAAWFAKLAPHATVIAIDYSDAVIVAHDRYKKEYPNVVFAKGDIANTQLGNETVSFSVCDQVIMHTENPRETLNELARITKSNGKVLCYWYRKKALPRELLDDYFRANTAKLSSEKHWKLSEEVLALGKMLSELKVEATFPDLPSLGIKGGNMNLQRFIYWNFIKCFWNEELGYATSLSTNFDWYSPVNAKRFSKDEVFADLKTASLEVDFFHDEEACYSGRFVKSRNV
ncbi:MAG: class I SAM-dependent methyltransferase [Gammaproteobacteria bacterium]|jgi:ubiquinone/menaquinone biosynthesis C-methylase UbiE|nr:class I SAM-dependent methyltransferase [Gammaproteobacteria bacterium]